MQPNDIWERPRSALQTYSTPADIRSLCAEVQLFSHELRRLQFYVPDGEQLVSGSGSLLYALQAQGPQTAAQLARARNSSRQNIQIMANRLESLGCIEFIANPGHKRSDLVQITERGKSWLRAGLEQEAKVLELICSEFTENEVAGSERLLRRLRKALEAKKTSREQPIRKASRPREEGTTVGKGEEAGRREPDPAPASAEEEQENELPVSLL